MRRYGARVDANQGEVVDAIRAVGGVVTYLFKVGDGVADLLVSFRGQWYVFEVKDGAKVASRRALNPEEKKWIAEQRAPVHVVNNAAEALAKLEAQKFGAADARKILG